MNKTACVQTTVAVCYYWSSWITTIYYRDRKRCNIIIRPANVIKLSYNDTLRYNIINRSLIIIIILLPYHNNNNNNIAARRLSGKTHANRVWARNRRRVTSHALRRRRRPYRSVTAAAITAERNRVFGSRSSSSRSSIRSRCGGGTRCGLRRRPSRGLVDRRRLRP